MGKKSKELDQFYTNKEIAKDLYEYLDKKFNLNNFFLVEPSAGTGSFSDFFHEESLAIDLEPKRKYMFKEDFLKFKFNSFYDEEDSIFTIGNPPFGKNSSLAIKFFNKSAEHSEYIAFIVPKTFRKVSIQNKLDLNFKLIEEFPLPKNSFIFNEEIYDVPCVFQVWEKTSKKREKVKLLYTSKYFSFVKKDEADFAIRRVGGLAGKVIIDFLDYKESSHYYIKSNINLDDLIEIISNNYKVLNEVARNSAGNPSLSKHELIEITNKKIKEKENGS